MGEKIVQGSKELSKMKESTPEALPPPPPIVPPNFIPAKLHNPYRTPMARRELGTKGQRIPLLTNHFNVRLERTEDYFYQYSVAVLYEDGNPVEDQGQKNAEEP